MRKTLALLPVLGFALLLSACASDDPIVIVDPIDPEPTFNKF